MEVGAHEDLGEEADDEVSTPAQERQLLRAHVNLARQPTAVFCRASSNGRCRRGAIRWTERHFSCLQCEGSLHPKCCRFPQFCVIDTKDVKNALGGKNIIEIAHIVCLATHCHLVERRRDMSSEETYTTPRRFCLEKLTR